MARVVQIERMGIQNGGSDQFYVVWKFATTASAPKPTAQSSTIKVGSYVSVKQGSRWYNGVGIASFVFGKKWQVIEKIGNRVVLGRSEDGRQNIMSPIHISNLVGGGGGSTSSSSSGESGGYETVDHYELKWWYDSGNGDWFENGTETTTHLAAVHTIPKNATRMRFCITPVAKTYRKKVGNSEQDVPYWQGAPTYKDYNVLESKPDALQAPTVVIDKYKLTASYYNISDPKTDKIEFEVYKTGMTDYQHTNRCAVGEVSVVQARAEYITNIEPGYKYSVRARAVNLVGSGKNRGEWSPFSSESNTMPASVTGVRVDVQSSTSVKVSWNEVSTADDYVVEYATDKNYFDSSSQVSSMTVKSTHAYVTGLEKGKTWYFRVAAKNEKGQSAFSDIVYKIIGTKPNPPTTWSLTATAVVGEPVILYWTHNTEDGSKQTEAQVELVVNGSADIITVNSEADANNEFTDVNKIYSYKVKDALLRDGAEIQWRVRTRGITFEYSEWSMRRTINVYAPPTLQMVAGDGANVLRHFPYDIRLNAGPNSQKALSWNLSIVSDSEYDTLNQNGEKVHVSVGTEIFSKVIPATSNSFTYELMPYDIILENGQSYILNATVSMNSGLIANSDHMFLVSWDVSTYDTDASVSIDKKLLCAYITPHAYDKEGNMPEDAVLSVYRREPDGTFTEIATGVSNNGYSSVTDPHPSLDYARYRIVARNKSTGVVSFSDLPGILVDEKSIIIQWEEDWSQFDYPFGEEVIAPPWQGSMLKLLGNVDTTENYDMDTSLVEYIGRKNPVSYYGTQRGVSASWSTDIPKDDKETLYTLRRLADWNGNVYVREPNGTGYLANVKVSWSIKHRDVLIPVNIEVKKVEVE